MNKNKYYSLTRLFSHNAYFNICMSGRGQGKTFSGKKFMLDNYIKKNKQSAYMRRTVAELDDCKDTFFKDIAPYYPDHELKVEGYEGYIDGEVAIYFVAVSNSGNKKSTPYPDVNFILFDEYIPTKSTHSGRFLKNEMILLLDMIETIFRDRETNGEIQKVLFLSNSVSYVCPLFSFFDIEPSPGVRFQRFKNNLIVLELFESKAFVEEKKNSSFGKLIQGTKYADYAIGNEVLQDTNDFIQKSKKGKWQFLCEIKVDNMRLGIWFNLKDYTLYVDEKIDNSSIEKYVVFQDDLTPSYFLVKDIRKTWRIKEIRTKFNNACIYYSTQEVKKTFMERVIKYL